MLLGQLANAAYEEFHFFFGVEEMKRDPHSGGVAYLTDYDLVVLPQPFDDRYRRLALNRERDQPRRIAPLGR